MAKRLKVVPESELEYLRKRGGCSRVETAVRDLYGEKEPENLQHAVLTEPVPSSSSLSLPTQPVQPAVAVPAPPSPPGPPAVQAVVESDRRYSIPRLVDIFSENVRTVLNLLKRCKLTWDEESGTVSIAGYPIRGSNIVHVIEALIGQYETPMAVEEVSRKRHAPGEVRAVPFTIETRGAKRRRMDEEYQKRQQQEQQGQGYIQWTSY